MRNRKKVFAMEIKFLTSLILVLFTSAGLLAKLEDRSIAAFVQNPRARMIVITPQVLQQPEVYRIRLAETQKLARPVFSLYNQMGAKVLEKQLEFSSPNDLIPFASIFNKTTRLPCGYYFYDLQEAGKQPAFPASDSLFFADVSNTNLPHDSTLGGFSEFVDVDGDSFPDIITGFPGFCQPRILMNDGNGNFDDQAGQRFPQIEIYASDMVVFDADMDGDQDVFFAAQEKSQVDVHSRDKLFLNDGSGHFIAASGDQLPQLPTISMSVDCGRINNDRYPDLLVTGLAFPSTPYRTPLYVLINDGSGRFTDQSAVYLPQTAYGVLDAVLADINRDSRNDIVMANSPQTVTDENGNPLFEIDGRDAVLVQGDDYKFVDETSIRMPSGEADEGKLVTVADLNNDKAPEIFVANASFDAVRPGVLYLNDGSGVFQEATEARLPRQNTSWINDVEFRDFDSNGYVDMYVVNVVLGAPAPDFLNFNNNGYFTDVSKMLPQRIDFGVSCNAADIECDGDFDVFVSNGAGTLGEKGFDLLLENRRLTRAATGVPRISQPGHFELAQNHPNPFNPETTIRFEIPPELDRASMQLAIFDVNGKLVRLLEDGQLSAGRHEMKWDGKDGSGALVASSVYFCRLQVGAVSQVRKLSLLK